MPTICRAETIRNVRKHLNNLPITGTIKQDIKQLESVTLSMEEEEEEEEFSRFDEVMEHWLVGILMNIKSTNEQNRHLHNYSLQQLISK